MSETTAATPRRSCRGFRWVGVLVHATIGDPVAHRADLPIRWPAAPLRSTLRDRQDVETSHLDFQPFGDCGERVVASVRRIRESGLLPQDYRVHAFLYDVESGRLEALAA